MENKEFKNALVNAMKTEIAQLANEQREQKKTRKLTNRPKEKSLRDIVKEINNRACKINILLYNYRWIKHGLKYWANRGVRSYKDYYKDYYKNNDTASWFSKNWDKIIDYGCNKGKTHGDVIISNTINYYKKKCKEYNIECQEEYLYKIITMIMTTQENNLRINLVKSSDDFCHTYDKEDFSINATTKEQYLAFKQYIKQSEYGYRHHVYVAYYMFKHRIGYCFENENLVDIRALHECLDTEITCNCWNMLWHGKNGYGGGEVCMKYEAIPNFKKKVINIYNKFAENNFEIVDNKIKLKK